MVDLTNIKPWRPYTYYGKNELFQFAGVAYITLTEFITTDDFNANSRNYIPYTGGGGTGEDGRGIVSTVINPDGDLIVSYSDLTVENAGRARGQDAQFLLRTERLVKSGLQPSQTNELIDNTLPVKLTINHVVYFSLEVPPPFSIIAATAIEIDFDAIGFPNLDDDDSIIVEYYTPPAI